MITIIPLNMSPASFGAQRWDAEMPNMKHPNSVLVFSRKDTKKVTLQIRTRGRIVNVWLDGQEVRKLADALGEVKKKTPPKKNGGNGLNAIGRPYGESFDPNYKMKYRTSLARLSKPMPSGTQWVQPISISKED